MSLLVRRAPCAAAAQRHTPSRPAVTAGATRARRAAAAPAASSEVPANVAEARAWIAAWRAKQQGGGGAAAAAAPPAAAPGGSNGKPQGAGQGGKFGAASAMADGTLVFTADQLKAVNYTDVLKK